MKNTGTNTRALRLAKVLTGHKGFIFRLAWSNSGDCLATPSQDGTVKIWEWQSGSVLQSLVGHSEEVNSVAWSPDDRKVATAADDRKVMLWDASTGKKLTDLESHTDEVNDLAWSPTGDTIASVGDDKRVLIWRPPAEEPVADLQGHSHAIWAASWSPDGRWLATGSDDQTIRLWSLETGERRVLRGHKSTVRSISWFPDSCHLASGDRDGSVRLWEIDFPDDHKQFQGHSEIVTSVSVSFDGRYIASKSHDDTIRVWESQTGMTVAALHEEASDRWSPAVTFHPKENLLATLGERDRLVRIWEVSVDSVPSSEGPAPELSPGSIFLSYSHRDREWLDRISTMLKPVLRRHEVSVWEDTRLLPGENWKTEIEKALMSCRIAILLVSPDFLASKFISEVELPILLERATSDQLQVLWIPVRYALFEEAGLDRLQAATDPAKPLETLSRHEQEAVMAEFSRTVRSLLRG